MVRCQYGQDPHPLDVECVNVADVDDAARFLAGAREAHDATPDLWHREMLKPPRTRSTACEFCGELWTDARLEDGLRRVFAAVDGPPPHVAAKLRSLRAQPHGGSCICHECIELDQRQEGES